MNVGKAISEDGPSSHLIKAGTPTMGGLLIWGTVAVVSAPTNLAGKLSILLPIGVLVVTLAIGIVDDLGTLGLELGRDGGDAVPLDEDVETHGVGPAALHGDHFGPGEKRALRGLRVG